MSPLVLHPEAYSDLEEIWNYIAADKCSGSR
jgi:plasmid stabilization system protein ParE